MVVEKFNFALKNVPNFYKCSNCPAHNMKMWRIFNIVSIRKTTLLCAKCVIKLQPLYFSKLSNDKTIIDSFGLLNNNIIICNYTAAIFSKVFGKYSFLSHHKSMTNKGLRWWQSLPTYKFEAFR